MLKFAVVWSWLFFGLLLLIGQIVNAQTLIPSAVQTVDMMGDTIVNPILPSGFLLSGTVTTELNEPIGLGTVTAQSPAGAYTGNISAQGAAPAYRLALPAGTYDLSLLIPFLDSDAEVPAFVYIGATLASALAITADATQGLVVSALPALETITGFVTTQDAVPTTGNLQFISADGNTVTIARFQNEYTIRLPLGTYTVNAELTFTEAAEPSEGATAPGRQRATASVVVNLDPVSVTDDPTIHDVTLPPTVGLSGTVFDHLGVPMSSARVMATVADAGPVAPSDIDFSCRAGGEFAFAPASVAGTAIIHDETLQGEPNTTGAYRMPLPIGAYRLSVTLGLELQPGMAPTPVALDTSPSGILSAAAPGPALALTADVIQNPVVPALPPVVTLSGQVTDALGQPVANAAVKVITSALAGVSNAMFFATAQTGDDGTYALPVLSGSDYQILACPPDPNA